MNVLVIKANNRPATEAVSSKIMKRLWKNVEGLNVTTYDVS